MGPDLLAAPHLVRHRGADQVSTRNAGRERSRRNVLRSRAIQVMSVAGMLAMKEQFPTLRNGGVWRPEDERDVEVLRVLVGEPSEQD